MDARHNHSSCQGCCLPVLLGFCCAVVVVLWYYYKKFPRTRVLGFDYLQQTVEVSPGVWKRKWNKHADPLDFEWPNTVFGFMERGCEIAGDRPCLGYRTNTTEAYRWIPYRDVMQRAIDFGAGLVQLGLKSKCDSQSFVGIFARTSPEWVIAEYGAYAYNLVIVPLFDSMGPDAAQSAMNRLAVRLLICGDSSNLETMLAGAQGLKAVKTVIFMTPPSETIRKTATGNGLQVFTFEEVEDLGASKAVTVNLPQPEDLAMLMFTSGTTGEPKAAMLTHLAVATAVENGVKGLLPMRVNSDSVFIGYLPLAHIMERIQEMTAFVHGAKVGFNSNGIPHLLDDIQALHPTMLLAVPRILNRVYGKMQEAVSGSKMKRTILKTAIFFKTLEMRFGIYRTNSIFDRLCFKKIQAALGGKVVMCATGSAPFDPTVALTMRAALGCPICEVYGQTESAGLMTCTVAGDPLAGHMGAPSAGAATGDMEVKLVDVPELGYFAREGQGEICVRGPHLMEGYYGMPEETAETIDKEGFLHTGDVGEWTTGGRLKVFDRKKHIFKLSQGEYVVPEKVESDLLTCPLITQIFVDGNSLYPFTVALVYPNYELLGQAQVSQGTSATPELIATLLSELQKAGKARRLKSYEIPKKIYILPEPFSLENGCQTPTQKVKRDVVRIKFKAQLSSMYKGVLID